MLDKNIKATPLSDKAITNIVTYGDRSRNCLIVETVASYYNFFNFINTPTSRTREYKEEYVDYNGIKKDRLITEHDYINYSFSDNPTVQLIFSQVKEIILNGEKRIPKSKEDLANFSQYTQKC